MALVKKTALDKAKGVIITSLPSVALHAPKRVVSKHREQNRARARQEKAAERIGAATEELAAGITEAASAAEELGHSWPRSRVRRRKRRRPRRSHRRRSTVSARFCASARQSR